MPMKLESELSTLRRMMLDMCGLVEQRVDQAIIALLDHRHDLAKAVRHGDAEVDAMDVDIESHCLQILARSHPVAGDLRFVLAVLRANNSLERMGDEAKSLAKRILDLDRIGSTQVPRVIVDMALGAQQMLRDAVRSFVENDATLAAKVRRDDQRIDDLQKEVFSWAQSEIPAHVEATRSTIDYLSIARRLERIGDLCTNLAEEVIFLVEGEVVRHTPCEEVI